MAAEDATHETAQVVAISFADGPIDRGVFANGGREFPGDEVELWITEFFDGAGVGAEGVLRGNFV